MENTLIKAVLEKKHSAFTIFYNEIVDHFFSYLKANFSLSDDDINDIISTTFIKIWNKLDSFDEKKGNFTSWVWTILRNTTKDFFKKKNEYVFSDFEYMNDKGDLLHLEDAIEDKNDNLDVLEQDYKIEQIKQAMNKLKQIDKEILFLRYTEGKSLKEIAEIIGISEGNVRVKIHRILGKLKKNLN